MPKVSREGLKPCNHILTYTWSTTQRENEELLGKMSMTLYRVRVREGLLSTIKDCAKSWASNCPADQEFGAKPKYPTVQSLQHPFPSSTLLKSNTSPSPSCLFFFKGRSSEERRAKGEGNVTVLKFDHRHVNCETGLWFLHPLSQHSWLKLGYRCSNFLEN